MLVSTSVSSTCRYEITCKDVLECKISPTSVGQKSTFKFN